jgi:hypothetical protein
MRPNDQEIKIIHESILSQGVRQGKRREGTLYALCETFPFFKGHRRGI